MNQIARAFSQGKYTLGIFIDIFRSFDTINHNILLWKLKTYGVLPENLKWFRRTYFSNRKRFILYTDFKAEMKIVKCGFPYDSILVPLLFLIFVNNHKKSTKVLDVVLFADDTNLFHSNDNKGLSLGQQTKNWNKLLIFFLTNELYINVG